MPGAFAAGGMVLAEAFRDAGSNLPLAGFGRTTLLADKSLGLAVAAMAG
jgi:hypothetical protein